MKKMITTCFALAVFTLTAFSQLTSLPDGGNKKASVSERIGITDVTIHYDRPGVKGREGKIWGQLVHVGFADLGFGNSKAAPWRAGANESTTIEFSTPVKIEGRDLPAGKYGFFIAYDTNECTLIFSKNNIAWGSFFYKESDDALRVKVKPVTMDKSIEWLKYEFLNETENSATVALEWEKLMIPFKVEIDYVKTQLESFHKELQGDKGFIWQTWDQAARWCLQHNVNLEEALTWTDSSKNDAFVGEKNFQSLSTRAQILDKLGRSPEAEAVMKDAMPLGTMQQVHQYGRQLLQQKKNKEALEVFKLNASKNPNQFTTLMGLTRGYAANADTKNALKNARLALPLAPNEQNKTMVEGVIKKLEEGKDIN
ncbi:MAG: DUF2911 domain-containing protein [Ferruginibacter sp.]